MPPRDPRAGPGEIIAICTGIATPLMVRYDHDPKTLYSEISAIKKSPISTRENPLSVLCGRLGLEGDEQADLSVHGGPTKAIYCYPFEHYSFWQEHGAVWADDAEPFGLVGENLCCTGFSETGVWIGDRWKIGEAELCVTAPRTPCHKFNARMSLKKAARLMVESSRCGWYMRVTAEGKIKAGDNIEVIPGAREISVAQQNALLARPFA